MKVLLTGASGFLGQALSRSLRVGGCLLTAISRHTTGGMVEPWLQVQRYEEIDALLAGQECVIHLAARVHVMHETTVNPLQAYREVNVDGTANLARQAAAAGVKRFVFVSSIKVNGEFTQTGQPFTVNDTPAPQDAYGLSKWEAEQALRQIAAETGMEVVIIRPPLVYGPGVKGNFASLMQWVRKGVPLPLASITHNRRSLVALDNLVDLLITCIHHQAAANQTFLVADGEDLSTAHLLRRLGAAMGRPARLFPVPPALLQVAASGLGKGDVAQRLLGNLQVDMSHTRQTLGWTPPISVDEGLRRAVAVSGQGSTSH